MALSTALMLAPTVLRTAGNLFGIGKSKKSDYEKNILSMADMFGSDAKGQLTETSAFKAGQTVLNDRDQKVRKNIENQGAVAGATDESKLASVEGANNSYNQGVNQLLQFSNRMRDLNRSRYLNTLGAAEGAKQNRLAKDEQSWANILNPLGQAGNAMAMSELFANQGG